MTTKVHCVECGTDFKVTAVDEPTNCPFCTEPLILDFDEEDETDEDEL